MQSRATGYQAIFKDKPNPKDKLSHVELELWLERNLRERARNAKRGSEERIRIFVEMLEKIAASDATFGCFVERALIDITAEKETPSTEVQALQKLIQQEKRLDALKQEQKQVEEENVELRKKYAELTHHIERRKQEVAELEAAMRQRADIFQKQRELNDQMTELYKVFDEPLIVQEEVVETDAPQIISLRKHIEELREKVKSMQRCIAIAEEEIETIKSIK